MGITINFKGSLTDLSKLPKLINEVEDICKIMKWEFMILDNDWSLPENAKIVEKNDDVRIIGNPGLKGIGFKPHKNCEWVDLFFDKNKTLSSIETKCLQLQEKSDKNKYVWNSVETQAVPVLIHIAIIKLLRWLKKNYIHDLEVFDQGKYWETDNIDILHSRLETVIIASDSHIDKSDRQSEKPKKQLSEKDYADYIDKLLENSSLEAEIKMRGGEMWKSDTIDPNLDNMFMKNVIAFEEACKQPEVPIRSLFPADYQFPSVESMDDNQVAQKLDEISDILSKQSIELGFNEELPDRVLYKYLAEDCIINDTITPPGSTGYIWTLNGCGGDCDSCFQKEYCPTPKELDNEEP